MIRSCFNSYTGNKHLDYRPEWFKKHLYDMPERVLGRLERFSHCFFDSKKADFINEISLSSRL